jgi:hypothetical protein
MNMTKYELSRELTLCKLECQRLRVENKQMKNKLRRFNMVTAVVLMVFCFIPVAFVSWRANS